MSFYGCDDVVYYIYKMIKILLVNKLCYSNFEKKFVILLYLWYMKGVLKKGGM